MNRREYSSTKKGQVVDKSSIVDYDNIATVPRSSDDFWSSSNSRSTYDSHLMDKVNIFVSSSISWHDLGSMVGLGISSNRIDWDLNEQYTPGWMMDALGLPVPWCMMVPKHWWSPKTREIWMSIVQRSIRHSWQSLQLMIWWILRFSVGVVSKRRFTPWRNWYQSKWPKMLRLFDELIACELIRWNDWIFRPPVQKLMIVSYP